ncbi:hypothetical protein PHYSODRAFT_522144, partial [Phytophthora sojae]
SQLTPYQRMRELPATRAVEAEHGAVVVDRVGAILRNKGQTNRLQIRMKLLWISDHAYGQWKTYESVHLTDSKSQPLTLNCVNLKLNVFKTSYEANRQEIDFLPLTATLWNLECDSELLPTPGSIVDINEYTNLQLYNDTQCQLTTRLGQLSWEQTDL